MSSPEGRFAEYVGGLGSVVDHADRAEALRAYLLGLLLAG